MESAGCRRPLGHAGTRAARKSLRARVHALNAQALPALCEWHATGVARQQRCRLRRTCGAMSEGSVIIPSDLSSSHAPSISITAVPAQRGLWLMLLFAIVIWCSNLEYRKLALSDEGRYSEIPRYMAQSGYWVTPRLNLSLIHI